MKCLEKKCLGNPKKIRTSNNVDGYDEVKICEQCFNVLSYKKTNSIREIEFSEKDIEDLEKNSESNKNKLKKEKPQQLNMF